MTALHADVALQLPPNGRGLRKFSDALLRRIAQRSADRRESARIPARFWVRSLESEGSFEEREGNISLGGAFWMGPYEVPGALVEIAFWTPDTQEEVRARAEVIRSSHIGANVGVRVRLVDIPLEQELGLARYIQRAAGRR